MTDRPQPASIALGFLTVIQEPTGWVGGYLVTNAWGRPLEFRLTSAVQPNRVQSVLYGPTLNEYLHADVIGKALVEKTSIRPDLIVTDCPAVLGLRSRIDIPVIAIQGGTGFQPVQAEPSMKEHRLEAGATPRLEACATPTFQDSLPFTHALSKSPLLLSARFASDEATIVERLDGVDPAVDLSEPFDRIREAVAEARKMGVSRAA